jgi:Ca-activated chloride channel family protein
MTRRTKVQLAVVVLSLATFCRCSRSDQPDPSVRIVPAPAAAPAEDQGELDQEAEGNEGVRAADNPNPHMARTQMLESVGALSGTEKSEEYGTGGLGLGDVGTIGHSNGAGDGIGYGRGGGLMGKSRGGGGSASGGPSVGSVSVAGNARASRGRGGRGDYDTVALDCSDADEIVVIEQGEEGPVATDGSATQGTLRAKGAAGEITGEFPLQHTEVTAEISGYIAKTDVEQVYANPFREVIEAVYVFPLPALGAVNDFVMEVGGRKIVGLIRPRAEAERIYAEARAAGRTASLLTQERPNIFTQSVANIEPGGTVKIKITYFERLAYTDGNYEWVFPMVVGPRYIPGGTGTGNEQAAAAEDEGPASGPTTITTTTAATSTTGGGGWAAPTERVPDADRITPPVLRPGERSGHDIGLTVTVDAGLPIQKLESVAHQVETQEISSAERVVKLSAADSIPNKDFVLRWSVAGAETQLGVLTHRSDAGGFLTLMMQPPLSPTDAQVTPREITFLLDVSGSQQGLPLATSKAVVERSLDKLRPDDRFNIFFFASGNGQLWERPQDNTPENVAAAKAFLADLEGGGGTEMLAGIRRALRAEHDARSLQMYVFFTDGYVGDEEDILHMVKTERGEARFFVFGIGSSVNRFLVDGVAEFGGGASDVVMPQSPGDGCRALERLFARIDSPVLVDVKIDWNGLPVVDAYPSKLPDLFAGQTIAVVARFTAAAQGTAYVEARIGDRHLRMPVAVVLPEAEPEHAALAPIWARWRIDELSDELVDAEAAKAAELEKQITDLAVEFRLVSQFTAFVAVDESRVVGNGNPLRVLQPVELPAGVSYEGIFGEIPAGDAFEVPAWGLTMQATESGKVKVGAVTAGTPAERAGIQPGAEVLSVNRTAVHDIVQLEGLLLQASGSVLLELQPGGNVDLPAP